MTQGTENFYADIEPLPSFEDAIVTTNHVALPDDWWVIVTDVKGSTAAIAAGNYKQVNTVGVIGLIAVRNIDRSRSIPFVFGGDGCLLAIPPSLREKSIQVLAGVRRLAQESFGLDLRAGMVQVKSLRQAGHWCRISKYRLSPHIDHAIISGRGWDFVETLLKSGEIDIPVEGADLGAVDLSGFECRWQNIPSRRDCKLSIVAISMEADADNRASTYKEIVDDIVRMIGSVDVHHPVHESGLALSLDPKKLWSEISTRAHGILGRLLYAAELYLRLLAGRIIFRFGYSGSAVRWGDYRRDFALNSDFKKFDGALKMIVDVSLEQARSLEQTLQGRFEAGQICFGLHKSAEAIVTCMIEDYNDKHTHFVDGSDGGYAAAVSKMKVQIQQFKARPPRQKVA